MRKFLITLLLCLLLLPGALADSQDSLAYDALPEEYRAFFDESAYADARFYTSTIPSSPCGRTRCGCICSILRTGYR